MINAVLYCSYSNGALGYQMAYADMKNRTLLSAEATRRMVPRDIYSYMTRGGSNTVCGFDTASNCYFMLMKRIELDDERKKYDEMGRKVSINIAFTDTDCEELERFTKGFFACFNDVKKAFADLLIFENNEFGYDVNFDVLSAVIEGCLKVGEAEPDFGLKVSFIPAQPISFIALEASWNYFVKMCGLASFIKPAAQTDAADFKALLSKSSGKLPVRIPDPVIEISAETDTPSVTKEPAKTDSADKKKPEDDFFRSFDNGGDNGVKSAKEVEEMKQKLETLTEQIDETQERFNALECDVLTLKSKFENADDRWKQKTQELGKTAKLALIAALGAAVVTIVCLIICIVK